MQLEFGVRDNIKRIERSDQGTIALRIDIKKAKQRNADKIAERSQINKQNDKRKNKKR